MTIAFKPERIPFDPYSLWRGTSRAGYWWDASDTTSMWKSAYSGPTTNVSADGDSIRTILDKSRMSGLTAAQWLAGRPNLFLTPDFSADTNWTKDAGWTIAGGVAVATAAAGNSSIYQTGFVVNAVYYVEFTVSGYSSGGVKIMTGGTFGAASASANGTYKLFIKCHASTDTIGFAAFGTTTLNIDDVKIVRMHDGTANIGVWHDPFTTVLYKTTGFGKHRISFPGTDTLNPLSTATAGGGQGLSTLGATSIFMGVDPLADTTAILMQGGGSAFAGAYQSGSGLAPDTGAGTVTYYVDGNQVASATRGTLNTAIAGAKRVVELRGVDTSLIPNLSPYYYGSAGFGGLADVYQIISVPNPTTQERANIINYIKSKM